MEEYAMDDTPYLLEFRQTLAGGQRYERHEWCATWTDLQVAINRHMIMDPDRRSGTFTYSQAVRPAKLGDKLALASGRWTPRPQEPTHE